MAEDAGSSDATGGGADGWDGEDLENRGGNDARGDGRVRATDEERGDDGDRADRGNREDALAPAAAFDVLGNEVRLGIIRELAAVRRTNWQWQGRTFAELRKAVGVEDAGNFSYHLDRLQDHFVVKDDGEYKLTYAGMQVAGAVVAGTYTDRGDPRTEALDVDCPQCADPLVLDYQREFLAVECEDHGLLFGTNLPPGAADGRSTEALLRLATLDARQDVERAREGVCPHCWGPVGSTVPAEFAGGVDTAERRDVPDEGPLIEFRCDRCGMVFWLTPGACIVDEPPVVALLHDHGVDVRDRTYLELPFVMPGAATLVHEDPGRVRVDLEVAGENLAVWLDERATVVDWERS